MLLRDLPGRVTVRQVIVVNCFETCDRLLL
jgi:hypothetical protein